MILLGLSGPLVACHRVVQVGSGCVHGRGSIGCGVQPTMLVLFELCFVIVKPSPFIWMSVAGSHDVMDCVPIGTVVDDTSVCLAGFEPYGRSECDTTVEEDAYSSCEYVAVGSHVGGYIAMLYRYIAMLYHFCWCVFVLCLVF